MCLRLNASQYETFSSGYIYILPHCLSNRNEIKVYRLEKNIILSVVFLRV